MPEPYNRSVFAREVETRRLSKRLTQTELGAIVGRGQQAVAKWEAGLSVPSPAMIRKVEHALDLDDNHLLNLVAVDDGTPSERAVTDQERIAALEAGMAAVQDTLRTLLDQMAQRPPRRRRSHDGGGS